MVDFFSLFWIGIAAAIVAASITTLTFDFICSYMQNKTQRQECW
jgi:hypothetical protein